MVLLLPARLRELLTVIRGAGAVGSIACVIPMVGAVTGAMFTLLVEARLAALLIAAEELLKVEE